MQHDDAPACGRSKRHATTKFAGDSCWVNTGMRFQIDAEALINAQARIWNTYRKRDRVKSAARGDGGSAAGENEEEDADGLRTSSADEHLEIFAFAGHLQIRTMTLECLDC